MTSKKLKPKFEYTLPPVVYGPKIYMANELTDTIDWGLQSHGITDAWVSKGEGITIGVADTGLPNHPDLNDAIIASENFSQSSQVNDRQGHSTHVCGTIAARENGSGVVGVAPKCKLVIAKVLGDDGSGSSSMIAEGVDYLVSQNCDIISMSLGGGNDPVMKRAIDNAISKGIFVICAAGNANVVGKEHIDTMGYPARYESTVAVGSYNKAGQLSGYSSRGVAMDITFPGEDILSTWLNNGYRRLSGTSMATPFCAGVVAELLGQQRKADKENLKVKKYIRNNADLLRHFKETSIDKGPAGKDSGWGWGIMDTKKFFDTIDRSVVKPAPTINETDLGLVHIKYPVTIDGKTGWFVYIP